MLQRYTSNNCQKSMRAYPFLFLIFFLSSGCSKKDAGIQYLKCKVFSTNDISCGKPLLDFSEDSITVKKLTGKQGLVYVVSGLPENLNVQHKQLYVTIRELKPEESFVCLAIGIWHPSLMVTDAKPR